MFNFKKNQKVEKELKLNSGELDVNGLEQEIVELVDIVEESDQSFSVSGELKLTEEVTEEKKDNSLLDNIEFPTEVRQIAEEFEELAYEEAQVELSDESILKLAEKADGLSEGEQLLEEEAVAEEGPLVFSGGTLDEINKVEESGETVSADVVDNIDREQLAEQVLESIQPEIVEIVRETVKKQLPSIIERIVIEELAKVKKFLADG